MKKFLLTMVAAAFCSSGFAAVGDETTILNQTFGEGTTLAGTSEYTWGSEVQGMINQVTSKDNAFKKYGLNITNTSDAGNYADRVFVTFTNPVGDASHKVNISYLPECPQDRGGNDAHFEINYYNENEEFIFGIQETSGGWSFSSKLIYAKEGGSTENVELTKHLAKHTGSQVDITVTFNGNDAIISVDGVNAIAYTSSLGIKSIKISVSGTGDDGRGEVLQNFIVKTTEVEVAKLAEYTLKYVCDGQPIRSETSKGVVGSEITLSEVEKDTFFNDDKTAKYFYVSDDSANKTIASDGSTIVTLNFRAAETFNYTVKSNVGTANIATGSVLEGESATVAYHRYILDNGKVYMKAPCGGDKKAEYNYTFTPTENNVIETLEYGEHATDGIYLIEAENMEGMTASTANNANIRCSNSAGGYPTEAGAVKVIDLKPGKYKVEIAFMGGKQGDTDPTFTVKAGENEVLKGITNGSWTNPVSEEFILNTETTLTIEGGSSSKPLDYILITGEVKPVANYTVKFVDEAGNEIKDSKSGSGFAGSAIVLDEADAKDFTGEDNIPYIYDEIDPENPTIAEDGTTVVTVKFHKMKDVKYTVKFVDQDGKELKPSEERTGDAGSAAAISDDDKEDVEVDGETYVYGSDNTKDLTYAYDGSTVVVITYNKLVGYTIKFVDEAGEEIQEAATKEAPIGSEIDLSAYEKGISVDGVYYAYVGATYAPEGNAVAADKVVTLTFKSTATLPYERTESTWSDADLEDWSTTDGVTKAINGGLSVTWGNTGWALTKAVNFTENSLVTLTASMKGGNTGRANAYEYIDLGGVQVRLDGQNKVGTVVIGAVETALSGNARDGSVDIVMEINQATKKAKVTVSGSCTGVVEGKIAAALPNKVIFGYLKNGSLSGDRTAILKSIAISEELQDITTADYTINYVCDGDVVKTEEGTTAIDNEVEAENKITVDGQKYYVVDDENTAMVVTIDGDNVLNVNVRKAYVYNYTVKNNINSEVKTGSSLEEESASVPFNKYILHTDGVVYTKNAINNQYNHSFTPTIDGHVETLEYTQHATDGIFFKEAEDMEGMTATTSNNVDIRCSGSKAGYADEAVTVHTLKPGKYKVTMACWGGKAGEEDLNRTFVVKAGDQTVHSLTTNGSWTQTTSPEFTLDEETPITFEGADASHPLDFILITGTEDKTTAVDAIEAAGMDVWYNLQGVQIPEPTSKGIYIHNGKKVIIR